MRSSPTVPPPLEKLSVVFHAPRVLPNRNGLYFQAALLSGRERTPVVSTFPTSFILYAALAVGTAVPPQATVIHPAVVRVIATERGGTSCGSGALVAAGKQHGLVITNWHVVRDASGPILVIFSDGFRSGAKVLRTDRDWDLAALLIWRPRAKPIPLASHIPTIGEPLTIAGYGTGWYRTATGRVSQYVTPRVNLPREMVQVTTPARHGDSGGPMINARGELAGVLFGTDRRQTMGSHCGPVHRFVAPFINDPRLQPVPDSLPEVEQIVVESSKNTVSEEPVITAKPALVKNHPPIGENKEAWRPAAVSSPSPSPQLATPLESAGTTAKAAPTTEAPVPVSSVTRFEPSELDPLESLGVCFALAGGILLAVLAVRPLTRFE